MATITRTSDRERELLRRSAMAKDQGPTEEQQANQFTVGLRDEFTALGDPQDPTQVSFPFLRRMRRDHMVAMGLHFIAMPIIRAPWYFEADDARIAAFCDKLIRPIYGRLVLTILRFLWAGYSPAAKNFEVINPNWVYFDDVSKEFKPVWDNGNIGAMVYKPVTPLKPENAMPAYKAGRFKGIAYDNRYGGIGYWIVGGERKADIDVLHSMWAVHDQENEDNSPFGFPRIAHCAPIFHMYRWIWTLLGRGFENSADPGPVMRYPREDMPAQDSDGNAVKNVDVALRIGRRRRSGSTVALPSDTYTDMTDKPTSVKKWDVEYPKGDTNFEAIMNFIGYLESAKLRAIWIQEQGLIEGSGGQSNRNVASEFGDQRDESQSVLMSQIIEIIVDSFVKPALAMNFPLYEGSVDMKTMGFGQADEDVVRQVIQLIGQAQGKQQYAMLGIDIRRLMESRGFPMMDRRAQQKLLEEAAKEAEQSQTPTVTPTQGRRALVTQTGFDETVYHQLGGTIELSADDDFVAMLPKNDVFSDDRIVAAARDLRSTSAGFLSWVISDFARYIGKQKTLDLDQAIAEVVAEALEDTEQLADADKIKRVVDKIMNRWRPRAEKLTEFSTRSRSILGRVFDRTASVHLSTLRSSERLSSTDKAAVSYLDDQGARLVSGMLDTLRSELVDVLTDGVRERKSTSEIAKDIRANFEDIPAIRASTIARTEVSEAYNFATIKAGMKAGVKKGQFLDGNSDDICRRRNGRIVDLADALKEKLNHPNAILGDETLIESYGEIVRACSSEWSGPAVVLRSRRGAVLTVGPNHPVLTSIGWLPAKFLRKGHQIISHFDEEFFVASQDEDLDHAPTRIHDVFQALRGSGSSSPTVASPFDFHGDGNFCKGEVDVVRPNRFLGHVGDSSLIEQGGELLLVDAAHHSFALNRQSSGASNLHGVTLTAPGSVGSLDMGWVVPRWANLDPAFAESRYEHCSADRSMASHLGSRLAGEVHLDELVEVRHLSSWEGHAYDLQTTSSMYAAGGMVVHNCTFAVRLLPGASSAFDVRYEQLDGLQARFDADSQTVLLSPAIDRDVEAAYLITLGDHLAQIEDAQVQPVV